MDNIEGIGIKGNNIVAYCISPDGHEYTMELFDIYDIPKIADMSINSFGKIDIDKILLAISRNPKGINVGLY